MPESEGVRIVKKTFYSRQTFAIMIRRGTVCMSWCIDKCAWKRMKDTWQDACRARKRERLIVQMGVHLLALLHDRYPRYFSCRATMRYRLIALVVHLSSRCPATTQVVRMPLHMAPLALYSDPGYLSCRATMRYRHIALVCTPSFALCRDNASR